MGILKTLPAFQLAPTLLLGTLAGHKKGGCSVRKNREVYKQSKKWTYPAKELSISLFGCTKNIRTPRRFVDYVTNMIDPRMFARYGQT